MIKEIEQMITVPASVYAKMTHEARLGNDMKVRISDIGFSIATRRDKDGSGVIFVSGLKPLSRRR